MSTAILGALEDGQEAVQEPLKSLLLKMNLSHATSEVLRLAKHRDASVRAAAVFLLFRCAGKPDEAVRGLRRVKDPDPRVRREAASMLGHFAITP